MAENVICIPAWIGSQQACF